MNITIHPIQWLHHRHVHEGSRQRGEFFDLFHSAGFWMVAIFMSLFLVAVVMAILFQKAQSSDIPQIFNFPFR